MCRRQPINPSLFLKYLFLNLKKEKLVPAVCLYTWPNVDTKGVLNCIFIIIPLGQNDIFAHVGKNYRNHAKSLITIIFGQRIPFTIMIVCIFHIE